MLMAVLLFFNLDFLIKWVNLCQTQYGWRFILAETTRTTVSRKRTKKTKSTKASRHLGYSKVRARTERMDMSVRLAFCILVLMGCLAFLATTLQPYKDLQQAKAELSLQRESEELVVREYDGRQRELHALQQNPEYRELRARDRLNYSKPGEHIFRIGR